MNLLMYGIIINKYAFCSIVNSTFFNAIMVTLNSQSRDEYACLVPAVVILLVIIFIGIFSETGTTCL